MGNEKESWKKHLVNGMHSDWNGKSVGQWAQSQQTPAAIRDSRHFFFKLTFSISPAPVRGKPFLTYENGGYSLE